MISPSDQFPSCVLAPTSLPISVPALTPAQEAARYDAVLVQRFNAGEESAFVEIATRYRTRMLNAAFDLLKNHGDAEEIVQDTFIRAHRALAKFRGDSSLVTWLHCITLNLARNRYWYFFRRARHSTISIDCTRNTGQQTDLSGVLAADAPSPVQSAMTTEFSDLVTQCLSQMDVKSREILMLRSSQNNSYGEIARKLHINVGTVKSRISRARSILQELLARKCPEFGRNAHVTAWFEPIRAAA